LNKVAYGALVILLMLGFVFLGCDNPVDIDSDQLLSLGEGIVPDDAKQAGSGAGYAGWVYDEKDFPGYNGPTTPFKWIEHDGVVRTGGSQWDMAIGFQSPGLNRMDEPTSLEDYLNGLKDGEIGGKLVSLGSRPKFELVPPLKPPMMAIVPPLKHPMVDVFGYTPEPIPEWEAQGYTYEPRWGSAPACYGGWLESEDFPTFKKGVVTVWEHVYRSGQDNWAMAIEFDGTANTYYLVDGKTRIAGYVDLEVVGDQVKITVRGLSEKDKGKILQIGLYPDYDSVVNDNNGKIGLGNWNGNEYHNEPIAWFPWDGNVCFLDIHAKAEPWLGYWGKIGEEEDLAVWVPDLDAPEDQWVPGDFSDPNALIGPNYQAPKEEWARDEDAPKDEWVLEQTGINENQIGYAVGVDIIEGQDHKIGKFAIVDTFDGNLTFVWLFYFPKSKTSHIQYAIRDNPKDIGSLGNGQWLENKNIEPNVFGPFSVYFVTVNSKDYESGDLIYVAAHCSN